MFSKLTTTTVTLLFASASLASPITTTLKVWPTGTATCGSVDYEVADVRAAVEAGVENIPSPIGSNDYPHAFNNREALDLECSSSMLSFPILSSGSVYSGGAPGADRVVFQEDGTYCGMITHTGAGGNSFLLCEND